MLTKKKNKKKREDKHKKIQIDNRFSVANESGLPLSSPTCLCVCVSYLDLSVSVIRRKREKYKIDCNQNKQKREVAISFTEKHSKSLSNHCNLFRQQNCGKTLKCCSLKWLFYVYCSLNSARNASLTCQY